MGILWRRVAVRLFGGFWRLGGRRELIVHDDGVFYADDMIIKWEWPSHSIR